MNEVAWRGRGAGFWGPEERARCGSGINMASIATLRRWAEGFLGPTALIIERSESGTRVALRFLIGTQAHEIEVRALNELRSRRVKPPRLAESLLALACACPAEVR